MRRPRRTAPPRDVETRLREADAALGRVIDAAVARIGRQRLAPSRARPFDALARAIVYQSVSGKAPTVIFARLRSQAGRPLTPQGIVAQPAASLRAAGLSSAKAAAIRSLAEWFLANPKTARALPMMPDDEVTATLTTIAGVGAWTVNVFLISNLGGLDVMPANDLGIRRGVELVYGLDDAAPAGLVREKALLWRPYRSIASIYLWTAVKLKLGPADLE